MQGSFDYALLRFASQRSAQDDSFEKEQKRIPALRFAIGRTTRPIKQKPGLLGTPALRHPKASAVVESHSSQRTR
jgi:hypothetical protein